MMRLFHTNSSKTQHYPMKNKKYKGVVVPMVTPVTEHGDIDTLAVGRIIEFLAQNDVAPLLLGTTGEGNSVSRNDGLLLVKEVVKAAKRRIKVYAGLTGNCFAEQIDQAEAYTKAGADVIVATLPTYYALTPTQMYQYYCALADAITSPLMLYNIKATTHMSIPIDMIGLMIDHPNIVGLKDSERDLMRMKEIISFTRDREDFSFFCGCAALSAETLALGADGIVPSGGNFIPHLYAQLYQAAVNGETEKAAHLQQVTADICSVYQKDRTLGESLAALKVMMQTRGLCEPWMLMPLSRLPKEEEEIIAQKAKTLTSAQ
jgi:4-hydroxy-tetrahydrodipicolinate synthase